jgi:hypothetical protein
MWGDVFKYVRDRLKNLDSGIKKAISSEVLDTYHFGVFWDCAVLLENIVVKSVYNASVLFL